MLHSGYFKSLDKNQENGQWTCCGALGVRADPCEKKMHTQAQWPDPEAKKYFIEKLVVVHAPSAAVRPFLAASVLAAARSLAYPG